MPILAPQAHSPIKLRLARDLTRTLKRGHPWVFADSLRHQPNAAPGTHAILLDKKGREIAKGYYTPNSPLAFRVCTLNRDDALNDNWVKHRMERAVRLRRLLFNDQTTGYRLFNGEGDGLPGLSCDVYGPTAVIQLDGPGPDAFWHAPGIADWVAQALKLHAVLLKGQLRQNQESGLLYGDLPSASPLFVENGLSFTANVVKGQKTGFFLDQRENRQLIKHVAAGRRVLNLFGYTGGFSVYAGIGGAKQVLTVDTAAPALETAHYHWQLNSLPANGHQTANADAFEFLESAMKSKDSWDLVIVDPPSFARTKSGVKKAVAAYETLFANAAAVTTQNGLLAAASCSSHIDMPTFLTICQNAVSRARRRATVLKINHQPPDHPTPLPSPEFRYLKFILMQIE